MSNAKKVLMVFGCTALAMLAIFRFAGWYADTSALPRYCENPQKSLELVERILSEDTPAGPDKRRPYIVAAKLIFLVPRQEGEEISNYLQRLHREITDRCGSAF